VLSSAYSCSEVVERPVVVSVLNIQTLRWSRRLFSDPLPGVASKRKDVHISTLAEGHIFFL